MDGFKFKERSNKVFLNFPATTMRKKEQEADTLENS
jgi:hypothetical protein